MKVIKYGPGYELNTHQCMWCRSEIEYTNNDIKFEKYFDDLCGGESKHWDGTYHCIVVQRKVLKCPVCSEKIILRDDQCYLEPIKPPSQEPPKKKRWFARKEN